MRITSVYYERLQSFGDYENETVGVTVDVGESESPFEAMDVARSFVAGQLNERREIRSKQSAVIDAERQLERINADIVAAEHKWQRVREFLVHLGVDVSSRFDDVPL